MVVSCGAVAASAGMIGSLSAACAVMPSPACAEGAHRDSHVCTSISVQTKAAKGGSYVHNDRDDEGARVRERRTAPEPRDSVLPLLPPLWLRHRNLRQHLRLLGQPTSGRRRRL